MESKEDEPLPAEAPKERSKTQTHHELLSDFTDTRKVSAEGLMRDMLFASRLSIHAVFDIVRAGTNIGLTFSQKAITFQEQVATSFGLEPMQIAFQTLGFGVDSAKTYAKSGLNLTEGVAQQIICRVDKMLEDRGNERGDIWRVLISDKRTKDAMIHVTSFLAQLGVKFSGTKPTELLLGVNKTMQAQQLAKEHRLKRRHETLRLSFVPKLNPDMISKWQVCMKYAQAAYGPQVLAMMNAIPMSTMDRSMWSSFKTGVSKLTGIEEEHVLKTTPCSDMYYPRHYFAIDERHKHIVIGIRGSISLKDWLVDFVCEQVPFTLPYEEGFDTQVEGNVHSGFYLAAQHLAEALEDLVHEQIKEHPDYEIVVCGHSLGAAAATLLTLIWAKEKTFGDTPLSAYAFGPPCSLSYELCQTPFSRHYVTSIVVGDDFVARLNVNTLKDVQETVVAMVPQEEVSDKKKLEFYHDLQRQTSSHGMLYSPGTIYLLESEEFNMNALEVDPRTLFTSLEVTSTFITSHFPQRYVGAIDNLLKSPETECIETKEE
eukprot:CAMPEP_0203760724 /NCGR_PEP_ID=MMETSP0098-20131031/13957_1 /ASSEMBLY_ACC=CAM_ASM_000208 /TAXON_ID=96639 /ORGANISM=" , Strain NY0313808BC1" /LENGTH=541 /DNA_ID=CAMNT_0050654413 /DNA_START=188 /DNA_END=1813 /DNA_ORIENTATION=-